MYRKIRRDEELAEDKWRIRWEQVMIGPEKRRLERTGSRMNIRVSHVVLMHHLTSVISH